MTPPELTKSQAAGQRIMAGFCGTELNPDIKYLIDTILVGGLILFSRNIENRDQVRRLCKDAQDYARDCGQPGLIIAVDQEGGPVARLRAPEFFEPPAASCIRSPEQAGRYAELTASELAYTGINMNMAPVMDIADPCGEGIMDKRSFGDNPDQVAQTGAAVIDALQKNRIMAVAKHFPGIGRTTADSHLELPELDISLQELEARDLVPFYASVRHKTSGIMLSHIRYTALDRLWPASLSARIAGDLLRSRMGYTGLAITDDLEMGAITGHFDMQTAVEQIIVAQVDIVLICHSMDRIKSAFKALVSGMGEPEKFSLSSAPVSRIMETKNRFLSY